MRDRELLRITIVEECSWDPGSEGSLAYSVPCEEMDRFLAKPKGRPALAHWLRDIANKVELKTWPFQERDREIVAKEASK